MEDKRSYREVMGERLKAFRQERGLTAYRVAKNGGIRIDQVRIVEEGTTNYTIDVFLGYLLGCELYLFFGEKNHDQSIPIDADDMLTSVKKNKPKFD